MDKKIIFSGIQPSSAAMTLGNYIGAMGNWVEMQKDYDCIYSIVDMHAITIRQVPSELRSRSISFLAQYLACGLNPDKTIIFYQSHVHEHAELAWVLNCNAYIGELSRMTQFKDKSKKNENVNMGLLDYPVLMAADILLYNASYVPVGSDQKQHVEIARDIAIRFNNAYSETFVIPEPYIAKNGAKIYSLQDPLAKMSKSDINENATMYITDEPEIIMRKFKRAVTDSGADIMYDPENKPGISNLLVIYSKMTGKTIAQAEKDFSGTGYGNFKLRVGEAVVEKLKPVQNEYKKLIADKEYLSKVAREGAEKASRIAGRTLGKVYRKIGFVGKD